jgi:hypothetical protein
MTQPTNHLLRVTLRDVRPKVTRGLLVPSGLSLDRLHQVLQVAMGWEDAHPHEFIVGSLRNGQRYGKGHSSPLFGPATRSEKRFTLMQVAPTEGSKFLYWYDFGDDWYHDIVVKGIGVPQRDIATPHCADGKGACPPEDCGGPPGYANLLAALTNPKHEDHEDACEWLGDDFDPSAFDVDAVNEDLAGLVEFWNRPPRTRTRKARATPPE